MTTQTHFLTFAVEPVAATAAAPAGPTRFRGVAYSGGLIPRYGWHGDAAIDLSGLTLPARVFALVDHDHGQRAGQCTPKLDGNVLTVEGELFDATEAGREVAALLKAGAPWQMSVGIQADAHSSDTPTDISVNGQTLKINTLFSNASLREVSFVPVGADPETSVAAFAQPKPSRSTQENQGNRLMDIEQLKAQVAELQAALSAEKQRADLAQTALAEIKLAARTSAVTELEQKTGQTFTPEQKAEFTAMSQAAFSAVSVALASAVPAKPTAPSHLFTEQATGGKPAETTTINLSYNDIYAHRKGA